MGKNKFYIAEALAIALIFTMTFAGCETTQHGVVISNVQNIREIYIKNAGRTNWGANLAGNINDIDISSFSTRVDIKVVDRNGIEYSKYNVPFGEGVFIETNKERHMGTGTQILMGALAIPILIILIASGG